ncbi:hypothetical protein E2C01_073280 [Portunus trituberculatus]|uniref:Uncharacterized protein n=1 Tax=Portunus trituberculatus TaxID=210409 RepID=A0A5B7IDK6_PORTR|nr:hypothetical protein [Portunus trituberculatus]
MSSDAESSAGEPRSSGAVEAAETSSGVLDTSLKEPEVLTPQQIDEQLHRHEQGENAEERGEREGEGGKEREVAGRNGERTYKEKERSRNNETVGGERERERGRQ